jgi:hypothetical protein
MPCTAIRSQALLLSHFVSALFEDDAVVLRELLGRELGDEPV